MRRATFVVVLWAASGMVWPAALWAKPGDSPASAANRRAAVSRSASADHAVAGSLVAQAGLKLSPDSLGVAGEYQRAILGSWQLNLGLEVGFHENRTLAQPYGVMQREITSFGRVSLHGAAGLAVPLQVMSGTTATAIAVRGVFGAQWRWGVSRKVIPHAQVVLVGGPMVTPGNVSPDPYIAGQLVIGASFDMGGAVHES